MKRMMGTVRGICCGMAVLLVGCDEPLVEVQTIQGLRVLGARIEAVSDPELAEPAAGDEVALRWLVVSDREQNFSGALEVCVAQPTRMGLPECLEAPFFETTFDGTTAEEPRIELELPALPRGSEWLARLVVCAEGQARFNRRGVGGCRAGSDPKEAFYRARVGATTPNRNPDLSDDALSLAGASWEVAERVPLGRSCDEASTEALPRLRAGRSRTIRFDLVGDDRERLPAEEREVYAAAQTESLFYSHFLSASGLERPFSFIDSGSEQRRFEVELELDSEERWPSGGRVIDWVLVVRDGRGGADWLRRQLCAGG